MIHERLDDGRRASARLKARTNVHDPYYCEWGWVVGDRIRRLRRDHDLTIFDLGRSLGKPVHGHYSGGFISRLERGRASAPLYVYLAIADRLEVEAGVLLGPDAVTLETSEAEAMLLRCLRGLHIAPHDAMTALVAAGLGREPRTASDEPGFAADVASAVRPLLEAAAGSREPG